MVTSRAPFPTGEFPKNKKDTSLFIPKSWEHVAQVPTVPTAMIVGSCCKRCPMPLENFFGYFRIRSRYLFSTTAPILYFRKSPLPRKSIAKTLINGMLFCCSM